MNDSVFNDSFFFDESDVNYTVTSYECGQFPDLEIIGVSQHKRWIKTSYIDPTKTKIIYLLSLGSSGLEELLP